MKVVAIIQARLGSSRLPGKVMFPLGGKPVLVRILERLEPSSLVDELVVATTDCPHDTVISTTAQQTGASVFHGDEADVLGRVYGAALEHNADIIVRVCADTPFISDRIVDPCVRALREAEYDYVSTKIERTFPVGYGTEVYSMDSFERVQELSSAEHEREHVTVRYRENKDGYSRACITAKDIFDVKRYQDRGDLRLTLDEPDDYQLISQIYESIDTRNPNIKEVIDFIDQNKLATLNREVSQKSMYSSEHGR